MPEPLKNMISRPLVTQIAGELSAVWPPFPVENFLSDVFSTSWPSLELKQRIRHISHCLQRALPPDYPVALAVLLAYAEHLLHHHGEKMAFEHIFLPDFVEVFGLDDPDISIPALAVFTRWSSAEFAVRPFLIRFPERMYGQMLLWSESESPMVRRLSSEGFRPRLPWGMGIPALKRDPSPILPVLENLKSDTSETVRRSVANNLNDISKDHSGLVLKIATAWLGKTTDTDRIVRHACRGLLKGGHPEALRLFGFEQESGAFEVVQLQCTPVVRIGDRLDFSFWVKNTRTIPVSARMEYLIEYKTASGKTSKKVFRIKETTMPGGATERLARSLRFQDLTTRKHYPGTHRIQILVNGLAMAAQEFELMWV